MTSPIYKECKTRKHFSGFSGVQACMTEIFPSIIDCRHLEHKWLFNFFSVRLTNVRGK